jgi:hypothetical protein
MNANRSLLAMAIAGAVSIVALWLVPPVGFVAALVMLVIVPPWGRSLAERAVISAIVLMGAVAVAFPRAGSTPVTSSSARLMLTALVVLAVALRLLPRLRGVPIPRPTLSDGLVALLGVASSWWLMAAYVGRNTFEIVSGLFYSGWDNQGHFTTFANTYELASTTWPTVDGTTAWNQWYPSLHTTLWSLAELGSSTSTELLDRPGLLWPFVLWSAISFGLCLAGLAWVGGDLAARFGGKETERWTRPLAVAAVAVFGLVGSPAYLYNKGFTNFMMGVTVMVVVAYVSARSWRSARTLGWFLIPLGALVIIGLWTPLALGLVPSGIVVAVALLKHNRWLGIAWLLANVAAAAVLALTQSQAIMGAEKGQSTADFTTGLGAVGTGMASFNIGAGLLAPIITAVFIVLLVRRRQWPLPFAVLGPTLAACIVAAIFMVAADAAFVGRLQSYYVLKSLDAALLSSVPIIAALGAVGLTRLVSGMQRTTAVLTVALTGIIVVAMFGYVGARPTMVSETFFTAPGIQAGADRTQGVNSPLIGEAIIRGRDAGLPYPEYTTLLWDGSGTLPNLWVSSLSGVMSVSQNRFYKNLPQFPYDSKTTEYVNLALNLNADLRVVVLWFRQPSGELLQLFATNRGDDRVKLVKVPMPSSPLCEECSL